jgi:WD40 repeat protein
MMSSLGPSCYDAFLSYNSLDRPAVREVADRLGRAGLVCYLDEWELTPGREFQPALAQALLDSKTCVVFLGPNGLAPWQEQELQVAIDRRARDKAFHVIPVLLPGTERPRRGDVAHLEFLINASWIEFLKSLDDKRAFGKLVWGITGTKPLPTGKPQYEVICPYRGLEAFRTENANFFFGRESLTGWLVSALRREIRASQGVRFLCVLGPSGSGKSSVVRAGLVPSLKAGAIEGSEPWPVVVLRPGDDPLKNLSTGIVSRFLPAGILPDTAQVLKLNDECRADSRTLDVFAQMALHDQPEDVRLLVVIDQFEEVFTYSPQEDQARARFEQGRDSLLANLLHAAATPGGRVAVVLTMRSDFLSACAAFPHLSAVLSAHQELVGPMTAPELREAIERPAFLVGCELEPALTERLLADVKGQPGALPLMQFALTEVWKKREVHRLTLRAYEELGGVAGALEHRADEIYRNLSPEDQQLCQRLFLRLVLPGEGAEDTKRRVSYRELLPEDSTRAAAVRRLIQVLASHDARLITTEGTAATDGAVEVAHEALIRGWTKLREWVAKDREGLRTHRRLTEAAQEWAAARPEDKEDFLLAGARLAVCREWAAKLPDALSAVEVMFLAAGEHSERQREQNELANERRLREEAEGRVAAWRSRQRVLWTGIAVALLLSGLFIHQKNLAEQRASEAQSATTKAEDAEKKAKEQRLIAEAQTKLADSRRLAALSEAHRSRHLDRAFLLAVEAVERKKTTEARDSLFRAFVAQPGIVSFLHSDQDIVASVAFSPDGKTLAAGYGVGGVVLWDIQGHKRVQAEPLPVAEGPVKSVIFSPDGKTLATGYGVDGGVGGVVLWDIQGYTRVQAEPLPVAEGPVTSMAFSPDGGTLAAGFAGRNHRNNGGVVLWESGRRTRVQAKPLPVVEGRVKCVAFSPDGGILAGGYDAGSNRPLWGGVVLWDAEGRTRVQAKPLPVAEGYVVSVAFSHDGKTLAAGYTDYHLDDHCGGVVLWDAKGRTRVLWDAEGRTRVQAEPLPVAEGSVVGVAFSPDGKTLAAAYDVGGVVLWDAPRRTRMAAELRPVAEGRVRSMAFSPDGRTLAAGYAGDVVLWDTQGRARVQGEPPCITDDPVRSMAFSPDGSTAESGYGVSLNDVVMLWDGNIETWKRRAGQIANRNLSLNEWRQFFPEMAYRTTFPVLPAPTYDERYKDIARNLTRTEWYRYFPNEPYRKTFDNLPIPPDAEPGEEHVSVVGGGNVPKNSLK